MDDLTRKLSELKLEEIRYADLFCGIGAFHQAFGPQYKCVYACDIEETSQKIYEMNYGIKPAGDIWKQDIDKIPDFDVLCAGFPCQPFSIAGKGKGFADKEKGNLFERIMQIVEKKKPKKIVLENVSNLARIHKGETFKIIREKLTDAGYFISHQVLNSKNYGSPQSRSRIFIICTKDKPYEFAEVKMKLRSVEEILDKTVNKFFDYGKKYDLVKSKKSTGMVSYNLVNKLTGKGGRQGERVYNINKIGPTICANSGGPGKKTGLYYIGDGKIRTLTVLEGKRMFGFPDDFKYDGVSDDKMMFHLGNSIVVNVLKIILKDL